MARNAGHRGVRQAGSPGSVRGGGGRGGQGRRAGLARTQRLHLPRPGRERGDGYLAVRGHRPVRLPRARGHATRRSRRDAHRGRRGPRAGTDPRRATQPIMSLDLPPPSTPANAAGVKHKGDAKTSRIPIKVVAADMLKKPEWIRVRAASSPRFVEIKKILREHNLHTVCEEASCPNIGECFGKGTATFMVLGDLCTRRCPFCDVAHGRPLPPDPSEPQHLADTVARLGLKYVVITSVDRDDLRDGGATHFAECIRAVRRRSPATRIEVLTPDFRGRADIALDILCADAPDVMNHNLETVPRLYRQARPGADYG